MAIEAHHHERSGYGPATRPIDDRARNTGRDANG
jgi:hypothetical protein